MMPSYKIFQTHHESKHSGPCPSEESIQVSLCVHCARRSTTTKSSNPAHMSLVLHRSIAPCDNRLYAHTCTGFGVKQPVVRMRKAQLAGIVSQVDEALPSPSGLGQRPAGEAQQNIWNSMAEPSGSTSCARVDACDMARVKHLLRRYGPFSDFLPCEHLAHLPATPSTGEGMGASFPEHSSKLHAHSQKRGIERLRARICS